MDEIIKVNDLSFSYDKHSVLENVNLTIDKGQFVGITGCNGSGKSTLIKLFLGQLSPTSGTVLFNGTKLNKIGYIPQLGIGEGRNFPATAGEIVMLNLYSEIKFMHLPNKEHKNRVAKALDMVGMKEFVNTKISNMSGGQQQRVMIAKALVNNPDILILDEPTTGIDDITTRYLYSLLVELNTRHKISVIMVSHDLENVDKYADKILEVKNNTVVTVRG